MSSTKAEFIDATAFSLTERFIQLADQFCVLLRKEGLSVLPYHDLGNLSFSKLSSELQSKVIPF